MQLRAAGLLLLLGAAGCAPGALSFDGGGAPDGSAARIYAVRMALMRGDGAAALKRVSEKDAGGGDHLLRELERGQVALYAGDARAAALAFDKAHWMAEGRVTRSVSNSMASLVTSDRARPYIPGTTEVAMLHYHAARAWVAQGNVREAAVDARRLTALLARVDGTDDALPDELTATLHEASAAIFAGAGDAADADVSRRLAARIRGDSMAAGEMCANCGTVVLMVERGLAPDRVSRGLGIAFADGDLRGIATAKGDAAGLAAMATAIDRATRPQYCGWNARAVCGWERRTLDGPVTFLNIAWPELRAPRRAGAPSVVSVGEHVVEIDRGASVSDGVAADFGREAPGRLMRAVARTAARQALVHAGSEAMEQARKDKKNKDKWRAAGVVAWLAAGASMAAERADTRSWALLPDELVVKRVTVPAGEYVVRRGGTDGAFVETIRVHPGGTALIALRDWELGRTAVLASSGGS